MPLNKQIQGKLMSPLKNALLAFFVGINPAVLIKESEKAIDTATQKIGTGISDDIAEDIAKNLDTLQDSVRNFGPNRSPELPPPTPASTEDTATNYFADEGKNDIIGGKAALNAPKGEKPTSIPEEQNAPVSQDGQNNPQEPGENMEGTPEDSKKIDEDAPGPEEAKELEETRRIEKEKEELPEERGFVGQTINRFVNRGAIKKLEQEVKKMETQKKTWELSKAQREKQIKKLNRQKEKFESKKKWLERLKGVLFIVIGILFITIIGWIVIPEVYAAKKWVNILIKRLKEQIEPINGQIFEVKKNLDHIKAKIQKLDNQIQTSMIELYKLYNE